MKYVVLIIVALGLTACEDKFRYPCQDPKNWEKEDCKPPVCTASQTCPEMLITPEQEKK